MSEAFQRMCGLLIAILQGQFKNQSHLPHMEMRAAASVGDLGVRRGFVDSVRFLLKALLKASTVIQIF
jgi:hypothetical protein